jgi:hypothetical protein
MIRILATALLAISLTASGAFATSMDDLVKRKGLYYKGFPDVPFTGRVDKGLRRGAFKNGKEEGPWVMYWDDGTKWEDRSGTYRDNDEKAIRPDIARPSRDDSSVHRPTLLSRW